MLVHNNIAKMECKWCQLVSRLEPQSYAMYSPREFQFSPPTLMIWIAALTSIQIGTRRVCLSSSLSSSLGTQFFPSIEVAFQACTSNVAFPLKKQKMLKDSWCWFWEGCDAIYSLLQIKHAPFQVIERPFIGENIIPEKKLKPINKETKKKIILLF